MKKSKSGFTLVELLIVIVVIAILAAITIPSYQHFVRRGIAAYAAGGNRADFAGRAEGQLLQPESGSGSRRRIRRRY